MNRLIACWIMGCIVAISFVAISWATSEEKQKTPEQKAWEDVNSLNKKSLQDFLKNFPDGELTKEARAAIELQDKITGIREGKARDAFTISFDVLGEKWKAWQKRRPEKGVVGYFAEKGDGMSTIGIFTPKPFSGGKTPGRGILSFDERGILVSPTGDGSIVAIRTDGLKLEWFSGLVFETPTEEPIYFAVIEGKGLIHLKGAGKVTLPDGKTTDIKVEPNIEPNKAAVTPGTKGGSKQVGITFLVPKGIELYSAENPGPLRPRISTETPFFLVNPDFRDENVNIKIADGVTESDLKGMKEMLDSNPNTPLPDYKRIAVRNITIGKNRALNAVEHEYQMKGNVMGRMRNITFVIGNRGFIITCGTAVERFETANKQFFQPFLDSIEPVR